MSEGSGGERADAYKGEGGGTRWPNFLTWQFGWAVPPRLKTVGGVSVILLGNRSQLWGMGSQVCCLGAQAELVWGAGTHT